MRKLRNSRGDTIVEVLLALTVIGVVIGGSAALASRNSKSLQSSQEHAVAQRYAQSQLEYLKQYVASLGANPIPTDSAMRAGSFCMDEDTIQPVAANSPLCNYPHDDSGGASYTMNVTLTPVTVDNGEAYDASVTANWEGLTTTTSQLNTSYRIYRKVGAALALGVGEVCGPGMTKKPGTAQCVPQDPSVKIRVQRVQNGAGNTTPPCNGPTIGKNGVNVNLRQTGSGATYNVTKSTGDPGSSALFDGPSIQNNGTYNASVSVPDNYQICGSPSQSVALSQGDSYPQTVSFTIRPVCWTETHYTAPYAHYSAPYNHYTAPYAHYSAPYHHYGAGYYARAPQYDGYAAYNGPEFDYAGVHFVFYAWSNIYPGWAWYNAWVWTVPYLGYYGDYLGTYADYLGYYGDYLGTYADAYNVNACPS